MVGALPNLLVVGAQKCGTTSLHHYLGLHPEIGMSRKKELNFFSHHRDRGVDWYRSHFDPSMPIRGEASPSYTALPRFPSVAEAVVEVLDGVRLIYLVRDPLRRAMSAYAHFYASGREHRGPDEALLAPDTDYVVRGCYAFQLEEYLRRVPDDRILIIEQGDLRNRRNATLETVFSWLGVDSDVRGLRFDQELHRTSQKRRRTPVGQRLAETAVMRRVAALPDPWRWHVERLIYRPFSTPLPPIDLAPAARAQVIERLGPDAERFRSLTGRRFEHWSV